MKDILEIGVGLHRRPDTTIAIDKIKTPFTDIIRDVAKRGIPFNDNEFDKVNAFDVIEHIEHYEDLIFLFNEIWRVLKPDGVFEFTTPQGIHGFWHLTHHRSFVPESFTYLKGTQDNPDYIHMRNSDGIIADFDLIYVEEGDPNIINGIFKAIK